MFLKRLFANVTVRKKHYVENDDRENYQLTSEGKRKRARTVDNVLKHLTENNEEAKAEIIANIIDKEGDKLGGRVLTKSKVQALLHYLLLLAKY